MKDIKIAISLPLMSYPSDLVLEYRWVIELLEDEVWVHEVRL